MQGAKLRYAVAVVLAAVVGQAAARPPIPDGEGGGGPKPNANHQRCLQSAVGSLTHAPATPIGPLERATLSWSVRLPQNCLVFGHSLYLNDAPVGGTGSMSVQPASNTRYALKLVVGGLTRRWSTTVEVKMPPTVRIKGNTAEWRNILIQALGTPNTTVILAHDVDMDLTFHQGIFIAQGVTLTSEAQSPGNASLQGPVVQGPPARDARHLGPRLYTTSHPRPLFELRCDDKLFFSDNVRINGFRLHGPDFGTVVGSDHKDRGIQITGCRGIEIANMEIAGWSGQAIYVQDLSGPEVSPPGRISKPDEVKIHDNFFHHNQQKTGGEGYGVEVKSGAYALIEHNVFDFNRHAIAAGGEDGTGYTARLNLVLKGGGVHNWDSHGVISWYTHQFDVHGLEDHLGYDACCGQAGERFEFTHNTFQYTNGNAIKVRGNPTDRALAQNNVFAHGDRDDAIAQNGNPGVFGDNITNPIQVAGNVFGADSYGQYGVCDIDGDGKDDLFLATGVSWWYSSAGRMHWTHLKDETARLDRIGLGDFDGDGRCDVFRANPSARQWQISSGGSGAWHALEGTYDIPFEELAFGDFNGDGVTDVFHRAPDGGQWSAISPGIYDWKALQSSSFPLSELRFGHFTNDRITDVIAVQGGRWAISRSGTGEWEELNPKLSDELKPSLMIGDIDADGIDDIVRYSSSEDGLTGTWQVSWGGRTGWAPLSTLSLIPTQDPTDDSHPAKRVRSFVGRFNPWAGAANVLAVDHERKGHIYIRAKDSTRFAPHSLYAY